MLCQSQNPFGIPSRTLSRQLPGLGEGTEPHRPLLGVPRGHLSLTPSEPLPDQASIAIHKHVSKHKAPTQSLARYTELKKDGAVHPYCFSSLLPIVPQPQAPWKSLSLGCLTEMKYKGPGVVDHTEVWFSAREAKARGSHVHEQPGHTRLCLNKPRPCCVTQMVEGLMGVNKTKILFLTLKGFLFKMWCKPRV